MRKWHSAACLCVGLRGIGENVSEIVRCFGELNFFYPVGYSSLPENTCFPSASVIPTPFNTQVVKSNPGYLDENPLSALFIDIA